ncbi:hypothetical protein QFC22_003505 [Naganishia vaughanmartiniae]|uniref:Uncharacterized protein n=1 Tax=Naganishia vaughanmartiniae TaxID=1424756 RepID=A0ACC2X5T7_9TREE|nr:hypothetical protein QFC22_003505 [Naganishia vaughanmartiniae]
MRLIPSGKRAAQLMPPVLAAFLSCLFIVINPLASLSPPFSFLVLTIQILYFYPSGTLVAQIESSALAFAGALVGLAYSNLFLYFAVLANRTVRGQSTISDNEPGVTVDEQNRESVWARTACALGLTVLFIATGWIRSKSPRLTNAARIMLFHGVWMLVNTSNIQKMSSSYFLNLFYPTLFAMVLSLTSAIIGHWFIPPAQSSLCDLLREAINAVRHEIQVQVTGAIPSSATHRHRHRHHHSHHSETTTGTATDASLRDLEDGAERSVNLPTPVSQARLLNITPSRSLPALTPLIRSLYNARRHSFTYAPLSPTAIRPFLITLSTRIGRNPVAKGGKGDVVMHPPFIQGKLQTMQAGAYQDHEPPFQTSLPGLAECMCHALATCARAVDDTYNWTDVARRRQYNLPSLIKRFTSARRSQSSHRDKERRRVDIREQLLAIQRDLESCVEGYETDLLIWLDTDVFAFTTSSSPNNGGAATCPVAKVSLADMPTTASVRARMFDQKLQQHMRAPQAAGHNGLHRRENLKKAHDARLKATSWLVAMLDLSSDILQLVSTSLQLVEKADQRGFTEKGVRRNKLWFPKLGRHWLTKAPNKGRLVDDMGQSNSAVQKHAELESAEREESEDAAVAAQHRLAGSLTRDERERHLQRQAEERRDVGAGDQANASEEGELKTNKQRRPLPRNVVYWWKRIELSWKLWWTSERSLQRRIRLSKWLSSAKHSKHIHYAFKMALGGMLLALPAFLPLGSKGRNWFTQSKGQWSLISYLYVLDITTGATFRVGIWRLIGTISGAVVGYVGYLVARGTSYGLVAVATVASLPIAWIMLYSTYPGIGIVAGITLPPILFIPYLSHLPYSQVILIALWRAEQVVLGIVAAFLINSFIFPYHARVRYFYVLATTLDKLAELYLTMSRDNLRPSLVYTGNMEQYTILEQSIESGISQCQSLAQIQHLEVSLLPKPYKLHLRLNQSLSNILELLVEIRMLRLSIPRRETVLDVLPLRQDLVSSVYITLFAIGHASRSRSPLPQFLPSPHEALNKWGKAVEKLLGESRPPSGTQSPVPSENGPHVFPRGLRTSNAMDLAALYAFAEREALSRLCDVLDETVEIARGLFGTQAFLEPKTLPIEDQEEDL